MDTAAGEQVALPPPVLHDRADENALSVQVDHFIQRLNKEPGYGRGGFFGGCDSLRPELLVQFLGSRDGIRDDFRWVPLAQVREASIDVLAQQPSCRGPLRLRQEPSTQISRPDGI